MKLYLIILLNALFHCFGHAQQCLPIHEQPAQDIHVALATNNETYLEAGGVAIFSILKNANPEDFYHFYFYITETLTQTGISERNQKAFEALKAQFAQSCRLNIIKLEHLEDSLEGIDFQGWGAAAMVRVMLPELLPDVDKVIYMDCDMIAQVDFREINSLLSLVDTKTLLKAHSNLHDTAYGLVLDQIQKTDKSLAGIADISAKRNELDLCDNHGICVFKHLTKDGYEYINSGLLVMDLTKLRDQSFSKKVFDWIRDNPNTMLPDQHAINAAHKAYIDVYDMAYAWPYIDKIQTCGKVKIFHYVSHFKPWKNNYGIPTQIYYDYKNQSPWGDLSQDVPPHHLVRTANTEQLQQKILNNPKILSSFFESICIHNQTKILEWLATQNLHVSIDEAIFVNALNSAHNELQITQLLLNLGLDPQVVLNIAIKYDKPKLADLALLHNANVNWINPDGKSLFEMALENGSMAEKLMQHGIELDATNTKILNLAFKKVRNTLAATLIQKGADVNLLEEIFILPNFYADDSYMIEFLSNMVPLLVESHYDFYRESHYAQTQAPIIWEAGSKTVGERILANAICYGNKGLVTLLIQLGIQYYEPAIAWAAHNGHIDIINFFKEKGFTFTQDCLNKAISGSQFEVIKTLIDSGLKLTQDTIDEALSRTNLSFEVVELLKAHGLTLTEKNLIRAARRGNVSVIESLVFGASNGTVITTEIWQEAILGALKNNHIDCAQQLFKYTPHLTQSIIDAIIASKQPEAIKLALDNYRSNKDLEAILNIVAHDWKNYFSLPQKQNILTSLAHCGLDLDQALYTALEQNNKQSFLALLKAGARVTPKTLFKSFEKAHIYWNYVWNHITNFKQVDATGNSLIHYAALSAGPQVIKNLLAKGIDINSINNDGYTALTLCGTKFLETGNDNYLNQIKILLNCGADLNATFKNPTSQEPITLLEYAKNQTSYNKHAAKLINFLDPQSSWSNYFKSWLIFW